MGATETLLQVEGLTKSYDGSLKALEGVSFSLNRGEFVSLIGSSGAGKSTLLRCINRLIDPTCGSVVFDGRETSSACGRALREIRRRMAMVFQGYNLVYRSTAIENVLQGRLGYKNSLMGALSIFTEEEKRAAFDALDRVGLGCCAYMRADQLSGGQKQRVGIASLDPKSSRTVMEHLRWAADERGIACLVSLHQVEYALEFSDRIIAVSGGKLVFDGAPDDLTPSIIASVYGEEDPSSSTAECC